MKLDSAQLVAFYEVAKKQSFSQAAKALGLSQPALSLRIKNLEEDLHTSLFIRESSGIQLTAAGEKLLVHCQLRENIENEVLNEIKMDDRGKSLTGVVRIVGFSTTLRSVLLPSLSDFIAKNPAIQIETFIREMHEIPSVLKKSEADFAISEGPVTAGNVENIFLGYEENVAVESRHPITGRDDIYLDNDFADQATFNFFKQQPKNKHLHFKRNYLDEVYAILDAVEMGWGRSVQPKHLIKDRKNLRIISDFKTIKAPIFLNYFRQPYYSKLHESVTQDIIEGFRDRLSQK